MAVRSGGGGRQCGHERMRRGERVSAHPPPYVMAVSAWMSVYFVGRNGCFPISFPLSLFFVYSLSLYS